MMKEKGSIFAIGVVLWALGVLFGGSVAKLLPGSTSLLSPAVVLIVTLLATAVNLIFLFKKIQKLGSGAL